MWNDEDESSSERESDEWWERYIISGDFDRDRKDMEETGKRLAPCAFWIFLFFLIVFFPYIFRGCNKLYKSLDVTRTATVVEISDTQMKLRLGEEKKLFNKYVYIDLSEGTIEKGANSWLPSGEISLKTYLDEARVGDIIRIRYERGDKKDGVIYRLYSLHVIKTADENL